MRTKKGPVFKPGILILILVLLAGCKQKEEPLSHDEIIRADLAEILVMQGLSCNEVVKFEAASRLDYRVECDSGDLYRVHVSAEGHIKVKPQQE